MKSSIILKSFSALSSGAVQGADASAPAIPESSLQPATEHAQTDQGFRELLQRRQNKPFPVALPYRHGGLNG